MIALLLAAVLYVHPQRLLSVRFPGQPVESDQETPSRVGVIHAKGASLEDERRAHAATAIVYPIGGTLDVEKMLDGARDQAVNNVHGKVVSERAIKIDGFPGRE